MKDSIKNIAFAIVLVVIVISIIYLQSLKSSITNSNDSNSAVKIASSPEKSKIYPPAKEIVSPSGFINSEGVKINDLVGKKVILVDFWTYSCINCQRTLPHLVGWYEKYKDNGLEIIGVHAPEFEFEKKYENVFEAVQKFGIKYPVVLDNDYATWNAYKNRYWPHKYLIDIDGFIVFDHIGEGAYEETETKIQELLMERSKKLKIHENVSMEISKDVNATDVDFSKIESPETYFGAERNNNLGNGFANTIGVQNLTDPPNVKPNYLYLVGLWKFEKEFAENQNSLAKIVFKYKAKNIYFVAAAENNVKIHVMRDGKPLSAEAGSDVIIENGLSVVNIKEPKLYKLVEDSAGYGEHTLEIIVESPGIHAFTFTFG